MYRTYRSLASLHRRLRRGLHGVSWMLMLGALLWAAPPPAYAQVGEMMITPTRVVLEGRQRSAKVTIVNKTTQTAVYRISLVNRRMREDGSFEDFEDPRPNENLAAEMIRFAPHQVVLEPGASQTVRLLVRKPRDLPPGEYRSHLLFRTLPPAQAGMTVEDILVAHGKFTIQLTPVFGITIPVIVRQGDCRADVGISDLEVAPAGEKDQWPVVSFRLTREGTCSVYGDVKITSLSANGARQVVGMARGIAVYTPNASRMVRLPLRLPLGGGPPPERVRVTYRGSGEERGRVATLDGEGPVLAQAEVAIPLTVATAGSGF